MTQSVRALLMISRGIEFLEFLEPMQKSGVAVVHVTPHVTLTAWRQMIAGRLISQTSQE